LFAQQLESAFDHFGFGVQLVLALVRLDEAGQRFGDGHRQLTLIHTPDRTTISTPELPKQLAGENRVAARQGRSGTGTPWPHMLDACSRCLPNPLPPLPIEYAAFTSQQSLVEQEGTMTKDATDPWQSGEAYERFMGRWSRAITGNFLRWLDAPEQLHWADVGSGTGALTQGILDLAAPASVTGVEPSRAFVEFARRQVNDPRARFRVGDAASLPLPTNSADVLVSGFVLNFVPDPKAALREMLRAVRPSGVVAAVVWDYLEGMEFLRHFWTAAAQLDAAARQLDEGTRFPLCRPEPLETLFRGAGLMGVRVEAIEVETRFADFMDYWGPFLGGTGPAPGYLDALSDDRREALRAALRAQLPHDAAGAIELTARGWAVSGTVNGAVHGSIAG